MSLQKTVFGMPKIKPNTFIGGVSATINTAALVASKLGISASRIKAFSVIGSNIQFAVIGGSYTIPAYAFLNNTAITYYDDKDGLVTSLLTQSLRSCSNITLLNFPNVTNISDYAIEGLGSLQVANFPSCSNFGAIYCFTGVPSTCVITTNITALTNGVGGGPSTGLKTANCIVNYIGYVDDGSWNTEIKGVAATESSRLLAGRKIGCSPAALLNFQIVGSDIRFKVYGTYSLKASTYNNRTDITAYNDNENRVVGLTNGCIQYCANLKSLTFNGVTTMNFGTTFRNNGSPFVLTMNGLVSCTGSWPIRDNGTVDFNFANLVTMNLSSLTYGVTVASIYAPKLQTIGSSALDNGVLGANLRLNNCLITVDRFMETSNAGAEEGDIAYARNTRGSTIVYIDN